ncbi:MAG: sugar phosphate isomerase/epimerase family protein [Solirubrobacterales bacterium]
MRFGASTFIWSSPLDDATALSLARRAAGLGFDLLEVCVEDPALLSAEGVRAASEEAGVSISVCGAFGPDRDISHEDAGVRAGAAGYLRECIDLAAAVGSESVSGPMYSATGKARLLGPRERERQWAWAVEGLAGCAEYAAERDVGLAIEPLNRFETDMVNTVEQGVRMCGEIGAENVGLLLDTFHMNIEERSIGEAIRAAGPLIRNFHTCENDRGAPGDGHVPWPEVAAALAAVGYDGQVVIESFTPEIEEIARAVSIWRPLPSSGDELARDGLGFLHSLFA